MTIGDLYRLAGPFTATVLLACVPLGFWKLLELVSDLLDWKDES